MNSIEPIDVDDDEIIDIKILFDQPDDDDDDKCRDFAIVDIVGVHNRNHFICKEFYLIDGDYEYHAIIKPPYSLYKLPKHERDMALWEIDHLHGLSTWINNSGDTHLIEVIEAVYAHLMNKKIIVENRFKANALKYMFRNCVEMDCIPIKNMDFDMDLQYEDDYPICDNHSQILSFSNVCECAIATARRLKEITRNNFNLLNYLGNN